MPILTANYNPPLPFRSAHFATIAPNLFRSKTVQLGALKKFETPDEDEFFVIENLINSKTAVCLLHGLEGSVYSTYMIGMRATLLANGISVISINNRGCGGLNNKKPYSYHSGYTQDLNQVLAHYRRQFQQLWIVGFSLGGSIALNQAIEQKSNQLSDGVIGISVPLDLKGSALALERLENKVYKHRFLKSLKTKAMLKAKTFDFPKSILNAIKNAKTITAFDDAFTAFVNQYQDANDYYNQCSTYQRLSQIEIPAFIINAANDTFLSTQCYPFHQAKDSDLIHFTCPKYGGHVGFASDLRLKKQFWHEVKAIEFIKTFTS